MSKSKKSENFNKFHIEFKTSAQKLAWAAFQQHDIIFLTGPAGVGKTIVATAFAINEILTNKKKKIIVTRPIVEAGESLGFLPGTFSEKVNPYIMPIYDSIDKLVGNGNNNVQREAIESSLRVSPLAYMRGTNFDNAVCIFDEAQNATFTQLKLFLTRLGENSKIIVTGDPSQSDIGVNSGLVEVVHRLETVPGIGIVEFKNDSIVRHPLVGAILDKLGQ